ncbi:uroporphyrinogen-III synthase [Granulicella aggregans]|uniref:Uroporphyrinogen-III synthase n=1 Tax=Granulicella aggregans TaxID=474949 RepID=A0A7W7ZDW8_9BACT|nr:uroporphyrinogen-III synthase [Granulicella aggregans]MBB5057987.1 uroporphyrinogen-III synthase [Granulicella aggregans]
MITRTRHQASELALSLDRVGADTILVPMIEVVTPRSFEELDDAIRLLSGSEHTVDWVVFTSANAVQALSSRALELGATLRSRRIAVIGPATAKAVTAAELAPEIEPMLVPSEYVAESLAKALLAVSKTSQRFLLVRAEEARDVIPVTLEAAGHTVRIAAAYRNVTPPGTLPALREIFAEPGSYPHVITFTSSSTARNLVALLASINRKIPDGIALASIGPITSGTLRELGYEPSFEADEPTIDSLAIAIARHLKRS